MINSCPSSGMVSSSSARVIPPRPCLWDEPTVDQSPEQIRIKPSCPKQENMRVRALSSILTERDLDNIHEHFHIPKEYKIRVPPMTMRANAGLDHHTLLIYEEDCQAV
ncbi:hypothetical protein JCGZ_18388 [Jatropha curcas]|uniref:Uncharacterized protein n=1 Tax=Jatropha curcas TaxID=180498 RepID=A0A067K4S6_JATCU|nr:hypothetical protein JCGZ_18388 [Jatropha curcas]